MARTWPSHRLPLKLRSGLAFDVSSSCTYLVGYGTFYTHLTLCEIKLVTHCDMLHWVKRKLNRVMTSEAIENQILTCLHPQLRCYLSPHAHSERFIFVFWITKIIKHRFLLNQRYKLFGNSIWGSHFAVQSRTCKKRVFPTWNLNGAGTCDVTATSQKNITWCYSS